jgi:hypothetical protein
VDTFADSNGDGVGDLVGLIGRLDYLARLGVTCLWLHPIHPTPGRDDGYDVTDFYAVDPRLGTLGDFAELLHQASNRGIKVIIDLVVNHTSDEHPWFRSAVSSPDSPYRDWYVWSAEEPSDRRQGMVFPGEQDETWTWHEQAGAWYYHRFYDFQPDLNAANPAVRAEIKKIMAFWLQLGVAGFRIDAAKHMQPVELDDIVNRMNRTLAAEGRPLPYVFLEVIDYGSEAVRAQDYYGVGHASGGAADVTEFRYRGIGDKFLPLAGQKVSDLRTFSTASWGVMPSDKAVTFVENHDTQRDGGIWYRDAAAYRLATVWLLAYPYGYPSVMSSYAFNRGTPGRDAGPPSTGAGETTPVACAPRLEEATVGQWVCEHRDPVIRTMVGFRRAVAGTDVNRVWDNGGNAIAFSRGERGFVAMSRESAALAAAVPTGLAPGSYCDLLTGGRTGTGATAACAGTRVVVDAAGIAQLTLPGNSAIVLHVDARL